MSVLVTYKREGPLYLKGECPYCSSRFLFTRDERDREGYMECPVCHGRIPVSLDSRASDDEIWDARLKQKPYYES